MLTRRFLLGRAREALTDEECEVIEQSVSAVRSFPARHQLTRRGEMVNASCMLLDGFICRYLDDREGYRQLVSMHVPGDFVDLHGFPLKRLDHDIATLGPCTLAFYDHDVLADILERYPRLARWLWFSTLLDAAIHREWIFRMGRLGADGRVAHLFCELNARLEMVELAEGGRFNFPATQADLAEACGITGVHVNRVLRLMRERDLLVFRSGGGQDQNLPGLTALAEFDPLYLYGSQSKWLEHVQQKVASDDLHGSPDAPDNTGNAVAEAGHVLLDGPDGVALAMTPAAAAETGRRLIAAAQAALEQGGSSAAR